MKCLNNKKFLGSVLLGAFVITGLYNAVVMNSESNLSSDMKLVKRLDEMYGVTTQGRKIASNTSWSKIQPLAVKTGSFKVAPTNLVENKVIVTEVSEAAIQEELTLNLIEVVNAQKWQQGLATSQFNGSLTANNGVIETLSVSLPDGQGLSINFTELNGNVFNYEMAGQEFSGMLYQVDQNSYMVSLTNGPLGGTRLRFWEKQLLKSRKTFNEVSLKIILKLETLVLNKHQ